jgi:hypothetical protein
MHAFAHRFALRLHLRSNLFGSALFVALGCIAVLAHHYCGTEDILDVLIGGPGALGVITQVGVYAFPAVALLSGIPVYSIIIRYNLLEANICGKAWANFWAVVFPWLVALPFYTGGGLSYITNYTSIFGGGFVNFILPLILYVFAVRRYPLVEKSTFQHQAIPWLSTRATLWITYVLIVLLSVINVVVIVLNFVA